MTPWKARARMCAASRRVQSLPQGGWVRKETQGSTTNLTAKANRDSSMSATRSGPEDVDGSALPDPCATVKDAAHAGSGVQSVDGIVSAAPMVEHHRAPIVDYRWRTGGAVCNLFTGTTWTKTHDRCSTIVQILRGIAQGGPTNHLAAELGIDRGQLLERRHRMQGLVAQQLSPLRTAAG